MNVGRLALVGCISALVGAACAPCAGTSECSTEPRFVIVGQMVNAFFGKPQADVELDIRLVRSGVEVARQRVKTGGDGMWEFRAAAGDSPAAMEVTVLSAVDTFAIPPFPVRPVTHAGDATVVGPWLTRPFSYILRSILHNGAPLLRAKVWFYPTGGVAVPGSDTLYAETNGAGVFEFGLSGTAVGDVTGTLIITHETLFPDTATFENFSFPVGYEYTFPFVRGTFFFYGSDPLASLRRGKREP